MFDNITENLTYFNHTVEEIYYSLFQSYYEYLVSVVFVIIYSIVFIFGVVSNLVLILMFFFSKHFKKQSSYSFASLSRSDLIILIVCFPILIADLLSFEWIYGYIYCKYNLNIYFKLVLLNNNFFY